MPSGMKLDDMTIEGRKRTGQGTGTASVMVNGSGKKQVIPALLSIETLSNLVYSYTNTGLNRNDYTARYIHI
jgi:hypothetical protein